MDVYEDDISPTNCNIIDPVRVCCETNIYSDGNDSDMNKNKRNRQKVSKNRETERPTGPFPLFPKATTQFPDSQSSEMIGKVRAPTGLAYICTEAIGGCLRLQ